MRQQMRIALWFFLCCLMLWVIQQAHSQAPTTIPVTGNLTNISGTPGAYTGITIDLVNCPSPASIAGYYGIVQTAYQIMASSNGAVNTSVWPNDKIDCNGTTGNSQYMLTYLVNGTPAGTPQCYQVTSGTVWNLSTQQPVTCSQSPPNPQDATFNNVVVNGVLTLQSALGVNFPAIQAPSITLTTPLAVSSGGTGVANGTGYEYGNGTLAHTFSTTIPYSALTGTPVAPVNFAAVAHQWLNSYNSTTGAFTAAQPTTSDISGLGSVQINNISAPLQFSVGTLSCPSCTTGISGTNLSLSGYFTMQTSTSATSGNPVDSQIFSLKGNTWNGSSSTASGWLMQDVETYSAGTYFSNLTVGYQGPDAGIGTQVISLNGLTKIGGELESSVSISPDNGATTWNTGGITPTGSCTNGSLYSNTAGTTGSTFYVCVASAWVDVK